MYKPGSACYIGGKAHFRAHRFLWSQQSKAPRREHFVYHPFEKQEDRIRFPASPLEFSEIG